SAPHAPLPPTPTHPSFLLLFTLPFFFTFNLLSFLCLWSVCVCVCVCVVCMFMYLNTVCVCVCVFVWVVWCLWYVVRFVCLFFVWVCVCVCVCVCVAQVGAHNFDMI